MPIKSIERLTDGEGVDIGIRLHGVSGANRDGIVQVLYDDISGNPWNAKRLQDFVDAMQDAIDYKVLRTRGDMLDDPDALVDPGRADFFHEGGNLVSRSVIISDPIWQGDYMTFTLRRAQ